MLKATALSSFFFGVGWWFLFQEAGEKGWEEKKSVARLARSLANLV